MSLIDELGLDYFNERFNGSMFFDAEGNTCIVSGEKFIRGHVYAKLIEGPATDPVVKDHSVKASYFKDLSIFKTPPLGWRMADEGRYMAHLSRNNRSYHRGTSHKILIRRLSPSTRFLVDTDNVDERAYCEMPVTVKMVMNPEYIPFKEGLEAMRSGALYSFCVSPTLAVVPEVDEHQALYLNTNRVGTVKPDGTVVYDSEDVIPYIEDQL